MGKGKKIAYIRVSSVDQNPARQIEALKDVDKIFEERISGVAINRPQLELLLDYCREEDEIIVHSIDRLARNLDHLRKLIDKFIKKGCSVTFIKEKLTFNGSESPMSMFLLSVMGAFGEFERKMLKERQLEGIAAAKKRGVYLGRKKALDRDQIEQMKEMAEKGYYRIDIAKKLKISKQTLYNYLHKEGIGVKYEKSRLPAIKLSLEEQEDIRRLVLKGYYKSDIAKKFKISTTTLANYLKEWGIETRKRLFL